MEEENEGEELDENYNGEEEGCEDVEPYFEDDFSLALEDGANNDDDEELVIFFS
jgi:hypothetical protein